MPSTDQIRESIEARISQLRSEMKSLESARAALHTNGAARAASASASASADSAPAPATSKPTATSKPSPKPADTVPAPQARTRSRPARSKRRAEVLFSGKLETMLRDAQDGLNAVAIAKAANAREAQVRDLLRELERTGQVRRAGTGRGSRWRLITDEERIAERAAELEARLTTKP